MDQRPTVLPFEAFLDVLRAKGYGVSLHEYAATADLLAHWDRTNVEELGDALAALIARNDVEVEGVRRIFREVYLPPPPRAAGVEAPAPVSLPFVRRHAWAIAAALSVALALGATMAVIMRPPSNPAQVKVDVPPPVPDDRGFIPDEGGSLPLPPPPVLPPVPERIERRPASAALGAGFLAALALFWSMKVREDRRAWLRKAWTTLRGSLPGPYHFNEVVRERPAQLPKSDVEDAATMLGRVFSRQALAKALNVPETLRATLRRGLMPTLVMRPRRIAESILVLQDICQEMRLWDGKVDGFLLDLRRQGIALQRMYFDGDLTRVSDRPHRPATSLESVLRARPDAPVLIIGGGSGLAAMTATDNQQWMKTLGQRLRRTWLTPVADVRLWPAEFNVLPIDVWPMTRLGLLNAVRQLAGMDVATGPAVRARIEEEGHVTLEDIERLKRLASLVPHPSPALLDLLRRRFAPDVSDSAILHLMAETGSAGAPLVRLSDADLARCLAAVRRENPDLEASARTIILGVLMDSEPLAGSLAHERWQIAVAVQQRAIGDLAHDNAASNAATMALTHLAEGPLWDEARDAMAAVPGATPATLTQAGARKTGAPADTPPENQRLLSAVGMPWSWPGLRELVPAAVAALVILAIALALNVMPVRAIEHLTGAYNLQYSPTPSVSTPQLSVARANNAASAPPVVDLYQEDQVFRTGIALSGATPAVVPLTAADTGKYYQVRAALRDGNLALSDYVWVTSDQLSYVLIDALPWANVTIAGTGTTTTPQQTPFTAALMPGSYQVRFENPNLTPPSTLDQTLVVPVAGSTLRVTMPNFDAARTVDSLIPPAAAAAK